MRSGNLHNSYISISIETVKKLNKTKKMFLFVEYPYFVRDFPGPKFVKTLVVLKAYVLVVCVQNLRFL